MEKKSVSATILVLFLALTFSVIGICFTVFVYQETKIIISEVKVNAVSVDVFEDKNLTKRAEKLNLSDMKLGLKPATGELDDESHIPSTITDEGTSEGYYASVYLPAGNDVRIKICNVEIKSKKNSEAVKEQRKNVFIAIKDMNNAMKSLEEDETELAVLENITETQKITILIWLSSFADENLVGAKISFTLSFERL